MVVKTRTAEREGQKVPPEEAVMIHARRFGLTSLRAARQVLLAMGEAGDAAALLHDLCGRELLVERCLAAGVSAFEPAPAAWPEGEGPPFGTLGGRVLVRAYGTLAFCCHGDRRRDRVTPPELLAEFPAMAPLLHAQIDYFLEGDKFGSVLVDASGQPPARLCRKAVGLLYRQLATEPIHAFHAAGQFVFAVVTGETAKVVALKSEFHRFRLPLRPLIVALPELAATWPTGRGPPRILPSAHSSLCSSGQ